MTVSRSGMPLPAGDGGRGLSRRSVLSIGALGAAATALSACGTPSVGAAPPPSGPDLVIGASLELSGLYRVVGLAQADALSIAQSMIVDQGGFVVGGRTRQVSLVILDNSGDPKQAVDQTRTLINQHQVAAVIGGVGTDTSLAMAPIAESLATPMLSLSATGAVIQPIADRRFVFKLGPDASDVADRLVTSILSTNRSKIAVMATNDAYGSDGLNAMTTSLGNHGGLTMARSVLLNVKVPVSLNYAVEAAQIVAAKPQAVVIWALSPVASAAVRALHTAGYTGVVYLDSGAASANTVTTVKSDQFAGVFVVSPEVLGGPTGPATTPDADAQRDFFLRYTQKDVVFDGLAPYGADALRILVNAATLCQSFERVALRNQMEAATFSEISGAYVFNKLAHGGVQPDSLAVFQLKPTGWIQVG